MWLCECLILTAVEVHLSALGNTEKNIFAFEIRTLVQKLSANIHWIKKKSNKSIEIQTSLIRLGTLSKLFELIMMLPFSSATIVAFDKLSELLTGIAITITPFFHTFSKQNYSRFQSSTQYSTRVTQTQFDSRFGKLQNFKCNCGKSVSKFPLEQHKTIWKW